jgi:hypothetical protein
MLIRTGFRVLEFIFAVGVIGSLVVVVFTTVEDLRTLFDKEGN